MFLLLWKLDVKVMKITEDCNEDVSSGLFITTDHKSTTEERVETYFEITPLLVVKTNIVIKYKFEELKHAAEM